MPKTVTVALRKESVDRNARKIRYVAPDVSVALRKESVDRNCDLEPIKNPEAVALRKESVDRNLNSIRRCLMSVGRSPQGERG